MKTPFNAMKTPFNAMKDSGAPDEVLVFVAGLVLVVCLSPWLDISLGNVNLKTAVPWYVSPIAALVFVFLFVPCIPSQAPVSAASRELVHRFHWIREHLLVDDLTVDSAGEAANALNGGGGAFRAAEDQYCDKHIEPILRDAPDFTQWLASVTRLRGLCKQLPIAWGMTDMVDPKLAKNLKEVAWTLPSAEPGPTGS